MGPAPSPVLLSFTIVSCSLLPYTLMPLSTLRHYFESILHLCAPSVPLCTICVSVRHLRLCAPSVSLCTICHLFLCLFPPLPPLPHAAIASATAAHRRCLCLCHHYTLPLLLPHTTSAAAAATCCHCHCHTPPLLPPHTTADFYAICAFLFF